MLKVALLSMTYFDSLIHIFTFLCRANAGFLEYTLHDLAVGSKSSEFKLLRSIMSFQLRSLMHTLLLLLFGVRFQG